MRFRRDVEALVRLGPRAVCELLAEIGRDRSCLTFIEERAARYAALDPDALAVTGGDRMPPAPKTAIAGGRG